MTRQREGKGPGLARLAALTLRLGAVGARSVSVLAGLVERGLERAAAVLLETVAQEGA